MPESTEDVLEDSIFGRLVRGLLMDGLFRDGSILIVATVVSGAMNYLYQVAMGRLLGPEQYGVFGSLFALSYLFTVLAAGVGFVATKYMASLSEAERAGFLTGFTLRVGVLSLGLFAGLLAITPLVTDFLRIEESGLYVVVVVSLVLGLFVALMQGTLRGIQRFIAMGSMGVGMSGAKLLAGLLFVMVGFGVYGALGAVVVGSATALAGAMFYLRRYYSRRGGFDQYGRVYRYALPSILVAFCFTVPTNADVVLVKSMFTSADTGVYTAVTVFGKVLIFLPAGITGALFPKVSANHAEGNGSAHLLRRALLYTGALAVGAVATFTLFAEPLLALLFGASYVPGARLLPWYGGMVAVFALNVVFLNFAHARSESRFVTMFALLTVAEIGAVYLLATTMFQVIAVMAVANVVVLVSAVAIHLSDGQLV